MLTRIELDGFKSFEGFALDLGPHAVILGANAAGKSNLFDAIRFLSATAEVGLTEAVKRMRGHPHELFTIGPDGTPGKRMRLAAEVLLPPVVADPWGGTFSPNQTRLRYSLTIERTQVEGIERLEVIHEEALPLRSADDAWGPFGQPPAPAFRAACMRYGRKPPFLTTVTGEGGRVFELHRDGHGGRHRPVHHAESTVLSKATDQDFPHLYALREELRSWRFLQLTPAAMRAPSPQFTAERLADDGSNLAAVLARIQARDPGALRAIEADLSYIIRGVDGVRVDANPHDRTYQIVIGQAESFPMNARVASDGTLRILALFTALHDPERGGLLGMEEPENGIHPERLRRLIARTREQVADPLAADDDVADEPLHQVLFNSHSPVVLDVIRDRNFEAFFADVVTRPGAGGVLRRTRIRPVALEPGQVDLPLAPRRWVSRAEVHAYLRSVEGID